MLSFLPAHCVFSFKPGSVRSAARPVMIIYLGPWSPKASFGLPVKPPQKNIHFFESRKRVAFKLNFTLFGLSSRRDCPVSPQIITFLGKLMIWYRHCGSSVRTSDRSKETLGIRPHWPQFRSRGDGHYPLRYPVKPGLSSRC